MDSIEFLLIDINSKVTDAWNMYFNDQPNFTVVHALIFDHIPDRIGDGLTALVSPANSFGDMQGGIDAAYLDEFGESLQEKLQEVINAEKYGELVVGDALAIDIPKHSSVPIDLLISAPTMRHPSTIAGTINAYLAFRAALICVNEWNKTHSRKITRVVCPGLGTAIGCMPPMKSAQQMRDAYNEICRRI